MQSIDQRVYKVFDGNSLSSFLDKHAERRVIFFVVKPTYIYIENKTPPIALSIELSLLFHKLRMKSVIIRSEWILKGEFFGAK